MSNIVTTTRTLLLTDSTISTYVEGERIYALAFPAKPTMPCMVLRRVAGAWALEVAQDDAETFTSRVQIDIWSYDKAEVDAMTAAVSSLLYQYKGTVSGQVILDTKIDLTYDTYESDTALYRCVLNVRFTHEGA